MWRLLRYLFTGDGHLHEWVVLEERMVETDCGGRYKRFILQCSHCGNIKTKNTDRIF